MQCDMRALTLSEAQPKALKCQKMPYEVYEMHKNAWRRGSAPGPAGGAYSAIQTL